MNAVIVDYGSGNLRSAEKALARAAAETDYGEVVVSADPDAVATADHILLPGVGAFADCKRGLEAVDGLREALDRRARVDGRPFLGVCVGMQLLADRGLEHGETPGLGWIGGVVDAIAPADAKLRVPHMGWNRVQPTENGRAHPLLAAITPDSFAYFVHSYAFSAVSGGARMADTPYGGPITAAVGRDTLFGVQFHPEKSQKTGLELLRAFLRWRP
ncbi:MAG: imidazole glycerol phosphate synthase subunit HisH [Pseudomonadota bacterium]